MFCMLMGKCRLVSLQERLKEISAGFGRDISNDGFRILAADNVEGGINLSAEHGQEAIEPLLSGIDLLILDNLSTLLPSRSESASDAWVPMQNWLLGTSSAGHFCAAHSPRRNQWATTRHVSARRCSGYGDSVAATGGLFRLNRERGSKFILKNYEIGWKASELYHLKQDWTRWTQIDNNGFVGPAAT